MPRRVTRSARTTLAAATRQRGRVGWRAGLVGVLGAVWLGTAWLLGPVPVAAAHAYLLASTPPDGYAVPTAPTMITLDFDESVTFGRGAFTLTGTTGRSYPLDAPTATLGGRRISTPAPTPPLPDGGYQVRWEVTAEDGDLVSGVIRFVVGPATTVAAGGGGGWSLDSPLVVLARWAMFAGLTVALGGLAGDALARRVAEEARLATTVRSPRPPVRSGSGLGLLSVLILAIAQTGGVPAALVRTGPGLVLLTEAAGFALALILAVSQTRLAAHRLGPPGRTALGVALLVVILAEGWRAHPHAASPVWGGVLTVVHLLAAACWIGPLVQVLRVARCWRAHPGATRLLLFDYSRLALVAVAVLVATGTLEAVLLLPTPGALVTTGYGVVLLVKLAGVLAALSLALAARRRLRRAVASGTSAIGRAARAEALTLAGVLAAAAVLVSTAPPAPVTTALAAAPPISGPSMTLGTLAGYTTVIATASASQLTLRMTVPGRDDLGTTNTPSREGDDRRPAPSYEVTARLAPPEGESRVVALRGCGPGCFTGPITWRDGANPLEVDVSAPPWPPATTRLNLPWPPHPDTSHLPAMLATMRAVPTMTVHQSVTSDYTGDPGPEKTFTLSGPDYLSAEPYAVGGGNPITVPTGSEVTDLRLGFPQGIAVRLLLGPDGRILREQETTPNHLVTTTIEYPTTSR